MRFARVVAPSLCLAVALAACSAPAPMLAPGDATVPGGTVDAAVDASPDSPPPPDSMPPPDGGSPDAAPCDERDLPPAATTPLSFGADPTEGGRPPLAGVVELLDDRTAVFADQVEGTGMVLSLVALHPCRAVVTDQHLLDIAMDRFLSSSDWSDRFVTHVVPLATDRVAVVGTRQRIELFAVDGHRLVSRARLALEPRDDSIIASAGRDDRLWTCYGNYLRAYRVGDAIEPIAEAAFRLPVGGTCRSLAYSPDGTTLWIAGTFGLLAFDPATSPPTLRRHALTRAGFTRVIDDGQRVVLQTLLSYGELGGVAVYRRVDLLTEATPAPVAQIDPVSRDDLWQRPLGVAVVDGGLAVETFSVRGRDRTYQLEVRPWVDGGLGDATSSIVLRRSQEVGLHLSPLPIAARGAHIVAQPWRRIVRIAEGSLQLVTGAGHGSLDEVWAAGGEAIALGPFSVHRVRAGDAPAIVEGGQLLDAGTSRLRLVRADGAWRLVAAPVGRPDPAQEPGPATLTCLVPGADGMPAAVRTLVVPASDAPAGADPTPSPLAVGGDALFQLGPTVVAGQYRLRRFPLPAACDDAALVADLDRVVTFDGAGTRMGWTLAAAGDGSAVLVSETVTTDRIGTFARRLLRLSGPGLARAARGTVTASTENPTAVAVTATGALIVDGQRVLRRMEVTGDSLADAVAVDFSTATPARELARILRVDGDIAYLATRSRPIGVLTVGMADLAVRGHCPTATVPRSVAPVGAGGDVLVGMPNAVATCRAGIVAP